MKLIIELSAEDVNNTTIGIIQQLFAQNTVAKPPIQDPYNLEEVIPVQPINKDNATRLKEFAASIENTLGDKERKALSKFLDFYLPKINDWKKDININNLWSKWVNSEH